MGIRDLSPEERNKHRRKWYAANREREAARQLSYVALHREHINKQRRDSRALNPETFKASARKFNYGITLEQYKEMLSAQDNKCAICLQPETRKSFGKVISLAVDHNHVTGKNRQLLCHHCNLGIACFSENIERLEAVVAYLKKHSELK